MDVYYSMKILQNARSKDSISKQEYNLAPIGRVDSCNRYLCLHARMGSDWDDHSYPPRNISCRILFSRKAVAKNKANSELNASLVP